MKSRSATGGLVYSTELGRTCPSCRQAVAACRCADAVVAPARDGTVRVSRQTKGRGGKAVTVVEGLGLDSVSLATTAKQLKAACGSGGTVKDGTVEVQGDHVDKLVELLKKTGRNVKRAGG